MTEACRLAFVGTSRSGLGHLRRISTVARRVKCRAPKAELVLVSNARPGGLSQEDMAVFSRVVVCPRNEMATALADSRADLAVLDTLHVPNIAAFTRTTILILRETPNDLLDGFRRDDGKPWEHVIIPNPPQHWIPEVGPDFAHAIDAAGWILRPTGVRKPEDTSTGIVLATGGGGTAQTRARLYPMLDHVIALARTRTSRSFIIRQAIGPRSGGTALGEAGELFDPGGDLNDVFRTADLVISTAGYNSVLELASTDTPALLAAIPRSLDDQAARVRTWGPKLGCGLDPHDVETAAGWLADQIENPLRRQPVDLGPDGAERAADIILEMLCSDS